MKLCLGIAFLIVAVLLELAALALIVVAVADAAPSPAVGTITVDNPDPHYGDTIVMTYHVAKRDRTMTGALLCSQGGHYVEIFESMLDIHSNDGSYTDTIDQPYPPNLPPFDRTQPSTCQAYVFREPKGQDAGAILTNVLSIPVSP